MILMETYWQKSTKLWRGVITEVPQKHHIVRVLQKFLASYKQHFMYRNIEENNIL
jgi:hypothetical protein